MFQPLKSREKSRLLVSETLNFGFPIDVLEEYSLLVEGEADVDCHRLTWSRFTSQNSQKHMLYLGYVLLRYVLIHNLEVSFNFHLTFLQLNVIKMFTVQ